MRHVQQLVNCRGYSCLLVISAIFLYPASGVVTFLILRTSRQTSVEVPHRRMPDVLRSCSFVRDGVDGDGVLCAVL